MTTSPQFEAPPWAAARLATTPCEGTVTLRTIGDRRIEVPYNRQDSVRDLVVKVAIALELSPDSFEILHSGRALRFGTLAEAGVAAGAQLTLVPAMRSGPVQRRKAPPPRIDQSVVYESLKYLSDGQLHDLLEKRQPVTVTTVVGDQVIVVTVMPNQDAAPAPPPAPAAALASAAPSAAHPPAPAPAPLARGPGAFPPAANGLASRDRAPANAAPPSSASSSSSSSAAAAAASSFYAPLASVNAAGRVHRRQKRRHRHAGRPRSQSCPPLFSHRGSSSSQRSVFDTTPAPSWWGPTSMFATGAVPPPPAPAPPAADPNAALRSKVQQLREQLRAKKQARAEAEAAAAPTALAVPPSAPPAAAPAAPTAAAAAAPMEVDAPPAPAPAAKAKPGRCGVCNRKLGLINFACRCEGHYCSAHRLPNDHHCSYDYKTEGRRQLAEENPKVTSHKL